MPVAGVCIHRPVTLSGVHAVLISRLVGALLFRIIRVLIVMMAVGSPAPNTVVTLLITLLIDVQPIAMPVVGVHIHGAIGRAAFTPF